jgi:hypothetical protein
MEDEASVLWFKQVLAGPFFAGSTGPHLQSCFPNPFPSTYIVVIAEKGQVS